jgi:hypothetical protein
MPNRWIDAEAESLLQDVIARYKKETRLEITRSQAIAAMYIAWQSDTLMSLLKGDEKR